VGDDEQSVYSWTGADPKVFLDFRRDFAIAPEDVIHLRDNYRCPPAVMNYARRLIAVNESIFANREAQATTRDSQFAVTARNFADEAGETIWIIEDLLRDRAEDLLAAPRMSRRSAGAMSRCFIGRTRSAARSRPRSQCRNTLPSGRDARSPTTRWSPTLAASA
jgi:superfamily I DNA/RNA helicase